MRNIILAMMLIGVMSSNANANVTTEFLEKLVKMTKGKVDDIAKGLPKVSKKMKETLSKNINAPKLTQILKKSPEKILLANKAEKIVEKGNFEKKFFDNQSFNNQLAMIVQSSKYGDEYFDMAQQLSHISPNVLTRNPQLKKYISKSQFNERTLQTKFIETLEKTGKWGWERMQNIGAWITKHPKTSGASGLYVWYVSDPQSFNEQLKESGKSLTKFLGSVTGNIVSGAGEAITEKAEEVTENIKKDIERYMDDKVESVKTSTSYIANILAGVLFFVIVFIAWRKRKVIHHFFTKADEVETKNSEKRYEKGDNEF